jgi:hypothetical protein
MNQSANRGAYFHFQQQEKNGRKIVPALHRREYTRARPVELVHRLLKNQEGGKEKKEEETTMSKSRE